MAWKLETFGNAILQVFAGDRPVLVTDPWLVGTAYFGSWALERPLSERQLANVQATPYVWFSHGHPDHFHPDSFDRLSRRATILLPDHYDDEMARTVAANGFSYRILKDRTWVELEPGLRILCLANENMDAILAIEAGGVLVLNKNDSPFCGENAFFRRLCRGYERSYLTALCAFDADMLNFHDESMRFSVAPPEDYKPGVVWATAQTCEYLGVKYFCCSSSQHIYVRPDSAWANAYRTTPADIARFWTAPATRVIPPFSTIDLETGACQSAASDGVAFESRITTLPESWDERLNEEEWASVGAFIDKFETLREGDQDFLAFTVGGERRDFPLSRRGMAKPATARRGVHFVVPRSSLLETVKYGYFDDLLIGNFMKTQLVNMTLYPKFTPTIAKLGGNGKIFTKRQLWRFRWHYFRKSPRAFLRYRAELFWSYVLERNIKLVSRRLGMFNVLKRLHARIVGSPKFG